SGNGNNADHGDWADAQITCGGSAPPTDTRSAERRVGKAATNATGVATSVSPSATFSEAIDPATVTTTNLTLTPSGGAAVAASVDDEVPTTGGSVVFQVFADGVKLADSGLMTGATATKTLTAAVTGKTTLQLVITDSGNGNNADHGDWADAQITCGGSAPPTDT